MRSAPARSWRGGMEREMNMEQNEAGKKKGFPLFFSIILVFCILGAVVFSVAGKISREMSASAIQNLSESLDLIQCTIEAILKNEAEFQTKIGRASCRERVFCWG